MKVVQPLFQQEYVSLTFSISWKSFSRGFPEAHSIPWLVTLIPCAALPWQEQQSADFPPGFLHFSQNLPVWQLETSSAFFWEGIIWIFQSAVLTAQSPRSVCAVLPLLSRLSWIVFDGPCMLTSCNALVWTRANTLTAVSRALTFHHIY